MAAEGKTSLPLSSISSTTTASTHTEWTSSPSAQNRVSNVAFEGFRSPSHLEASDFRRSARGSFPRLVEALGDAVTHVACGMEHTAAVTKDGSVYTWGTSSYGKLGLGQNFHGEGVEADRHTQHSNGNNQQQADNPEKIIVSKPALVTSLKGISIQSVFCGQEHSAAIASNGDLYTWGRGANGRLGHRNEEVMWYPRKVEWSPSPDNNDNKTRVISLGCGSCHTVVLCATGSNMQGRKIYAWGSDKFGQLGIESGADATSPRSLELDHALLQVVASDTYSAAVSSSGQVLTWGSGEFGRLGYSDTRQQRVPRLVDGLNNIHIIQVALGKYHTAAIDSRGQVYTWGWGLNGQLGHGNEQNQEEPRVVEGLKNYPVMHIACGDTHTAAVTSESNDVYTWGGGTDGQLGHGDKVRQNVPRLVQVLRSKGVRIVACGKRHTAALSMSGQLFTWGGRKEGQLGHGEEGDKLFDMIHATLRSTTQPSNNSGASSPSYSSSPISSHRHSPLFVNAAMDDFHGVGDVQSTYPFNDLTRASDTSSSTTSTAASDSLVPRVHANSGADDKDWLRDRMGIMDKENQHLKKENDALKRKIEQLELERRLAENHRVIASSTSATSATEKLEHIPLPPVTNNNNGSPAKVNISTDHFLAIMDQIRESCKKLDACSIESLNTGDNNMGLAELVLESNGNIDRVVRQICNQLLGNNASLNAMDVTDVQFREFVFEIFQENANLRKRMNYYTEGIDAAMKLLTKYRHEIEARDNVDKSAQLLPRFGKPPLDRRPRRETSKARHSFFCGTGV
eukprot:GILJ01003128.1.p1 GENE.GILJ01003128.1~~GILJ01003128.1.p1  ORF type:complete len:794 (-),score=80.20 GILJ01003128.1:478-2859(-)